MSKYIYKVEPDRSALNRKQTFFQGCWGIVDSVISILTLGYYGGRYADRHLWAQVKINLDKVKAERTFSDLSKITSRGLIECCNCDDTTSDEKTAKDDEWGWRYGPNNGQEWFCPECMYQEEL